MFYTFWMNYKLIYKHNKELGSLTLKRWPRQMPVRDDSSMFNSTPSASSALTQLTWNWDLNMRESAWILNSALMNTPIINTNHKLCQQKLSIIQKLLHPTYRSPCIKASNSHCCICHFTTLTVTNRNKHIQTTLPLNPLPTSQMWTQTLPTSKSLNIW